jgi:hypothetical protein
VLIEYADISNLKNIVWHSNDKMEEFYDKYFPDDICDEWDRKEQLKSHGDGLLGPDDKPTIWKYSRNFMTKAPRLAWNTTKAVNKYLDDVNMDECSIERLI